MLTLAKPFSGFSLFLVKIALSLATFLIVLDYSIANVSLPYIAGDLSVSVNEGTYVITSFAVGSAIALPLTGFLARRFGQVKLLITSLLLFTLFSYLCGSAWNYETLVLARFLQGIAAGPMAPLSQSLILLTHPPEQRSKAIAFWSMIVIVAPVVGPLLGGWISVNYVWRWIFYINLPIGLVSALAIWALLKGAKEKTEEVHIDWIGLFLLSLFVASFQVFLDKGEQYDWLRSPWMRTFFAVALVSFTSLVIWGLTYPKPALSVRLLRFKSFALSILFLAVSYGIYFGTIVLIPLWLQKTMGYDALWAGIAVAPIGLAPVFFSIFSAPLIKRFGIAKILLLSFIFFALSCFYTAFFDTDVDLWHIWVSRFLLGCALTVYMGSLLTLSVQDIPEEKLPNATGFFHFVRAMVGGIGTSVFTTLWERRTILHYERLGSVVTPFDANTEGFLQGLEGMGVGGEKGRAVLNQMVEQQAAVLALNDCFWLMAWAFLVLMAFLPLIRGAKSQAAEPVGTSE